MAIDTTRQLIQQITNASSVGENTATRVGNAMEAMLNDVKAADDKAVAATNRINTTEQGIANANQRLTTEEGVNAEQSAQIAGLKQDLQNIRPVTIEGDVVNNPDNVFLTSANDEITPKERTTSLSAKGHYIMRPTDNFAAKLKANYIHEIPFDVNLGGASVTIPANAVLKFTGGKISGGSLVLQNTFLDGDVKLSADVAVSGTCANLTAKQSWFADNDVDAWHRFMSNVGGCKVYTYEGGTYAPTVRVAKNVDSAVEIQGNGATLNFTYSASMLPRMVHIKPSSVTFDWVNLSAVAKKGDRTFTVADGTKFKVGDVVILRDKTNYSYSPYRAYYKQGEIFTIQAITSNTITGDHAVYGNYTHLNGDCVVSKLNIVNVKVKDLKINITNPDSSANYQAGLVVEFASADIENVACTNFQQNIVINSNYNTSIVNCSGVSSKTYFQTDHYGLTIAASQGVTVTGGNYVARNHGIAIGGSDNDGNIVNRRILIQNTTSGVSEGSSNSSLNSHGNAEYVTFRDNVCTGVAMGGSNQMAINNDCTTGNVTCSEVTSFNFSIIGNRCAALGWQMSAFVDTSAWTPNTGKDTLIIDGNDLTYRITSSIRVNAEDYPNCKNAVIRVTNNTTYFFGGTKSGIHLVCIPSADNTESAASGWENNLAEGATVIVRGNKLYTSFYDWNIAGRKVVFEDNDVELLDAKALHFYCEDLSVLRNTIVKGFDNTSYGAIRMDGNKKAYKHLRIIGNYIKDINLCNLSITSEGDEVWEISDNFIDNTAAYWGFINNAATTADARLGMLVMRQNIGNNCLSTSMVKKMIELYDIDSSTGLYNAVYDSGGGTMTTKVTMPLLAGITGKRPAPNNAKMVGMGYFDTTLGKPINVKSVASNTPTWCEADGAVAGTKRSGTTAQRPTGSAIYVGYRYFDTTIGKPIFAKTISGDTVTWVDATGTTV